MNSYLYSISNRGLLINNLATPEINLGRIELPSERNDYLF